LLGSITSVAQPADLSDVRLDEQVADVLFEKLVMALRDESSFKVRLQAAVMLGRSADPRAFEPLIAALSSDENHTVRAAAATALSNLDDPRAISHIIDRVATDPDPFVREEAKRALAKYSRDEALPYVVATYGSDIQEVRRQAVVYIAQSPDEAGQQILMRALGDTEQIFVVSKTAIAEMPAAEALEFLKTALEHRNASVRQGAVRVLHSIASPEAAELILKVYERDIEADGVRNETCRALRDLRQHLKIAKVVEEATNHPQKHARAKALKLLGVIGGDQAEKVLREALTDQDVYLRGTAVMAMAELGSTAVIPSLEKMEADPANQRILHLVRHTLKQLRKKQPTGNR
jgi:HEAT repeat protein